MVAVWICYVARVTLQHAQQELVEGARALLARWAEPERRSLLSRVMHSPTDQPTPRSVHKARRNTA